MFVIHKVSRNIAYWKKPFMCWSRRGVLMWVRSKVTKATIQC